MCVCVCLIKIEGRKYQESRLDISDDQDKIYSEYFGKKVSCFMFYILIIKKIIYVTAGSWKAIQEGKSKWKIPPKVELTGDFCLLGRIKATFFPWISALDISGCNRINCNVMSVLSTIGSTDNFDLMEFQKRNKGNT